MEPGAQRDEIISRHEKNLLGIDPGAKDKGGLAGRPSCYDYGAGVIPRR